MSYLPHHPLRILVFAPEAASERLTAPTIRALGIARHLARRFETVLALPNHTEMFRQEAFRTRVGSRREAARWLGEYDVVISRGTEYPARAVARRSRRGPIQVFDLYDPFFLQILAGAANVGLPADPHAPHVRRRMALLLKRGDFFLCASPQQRQLWLGALFALGRLDKGQRTTATTGTIGTIGMKGMAAHRLPEELVGVCPFGHDGSAPRAAERALKGVRPGIGAGDRVILWNGGVWNWFDPLTLIRAMTELAREGPDIKLVFMAVRYPDSGFTGYEMVEKARALARDLGVADRNVFFHEEWVPFDERAAWLLDADLAAATAPEGAENTFAFRTRLVDAVWAGVPILCTRGGFMGDFVERNEVGLTVPGGDPAALKAAILRALEPEAQARFRANLAGCRHELQWDNCLKPLGEFVERVARGEYRRAPEPRWLPWAQYLAYKAPTLVEGLFLRVGKQDDEAGQSAISPKKSGAGR
ncbi:MAG: glycosyltransferase [Candidatus Sumerlaeota bacterium]|nr:glycosyltransferase [Candidatus Sumerlaeota bacterium]